MEDAFYRDRLRERWDVDVIIPNDDDRLLVDRVIFEELTTSRIEPASKRAYLSIVDRLASRGAQAIVLGCTEIGLLIGDADTAIPLIDSAQVHAHAAVAASLAVTGAR